MIELNRGDSMKIYKYGDMYQYRFDGETDKLGVNIYCYIKNKEAIMFDSGYEEQFLQVKKDLDNEGVQLKKLVLTHFHPDHIGGIKHCQDIDILGSVYSDETLKMFYDDYHLLLPKTVISEETEIEFHGDKITLIPNPSHSKCTMMIYLKNYIFAADDVMFFDDNEQCIPYCATDVETHLMGIKKLKKVAEGKLILPSHGRALKCTLYFKFAIMYLGHILKHPTQSYEDFNTLYRIDFRNSKWHNLNTSKIQSVN